MVFLENFSTKFKTKFSKNKLEIIKKMLIIYVYNASASTLDGFYLWQISIPYFNELCTKN